MLIQSALNATDSHADNGQPNGGAAAAEGQRVAEEREREEERLREVFGRLDTDGSGGLDTVNPNDPAKALLSCVRDMLCGLAEAEEPQ